MDNPQTGQPPDGQAPASKYLVDTSRANAGMHRIGLHASVTGQQAQMTTIYMPAGASGQWHSHPQESFVTVIEGSYEPFYVGDESFVLKPGMACHVPANVRHKGQVGPNPTIEIEMFAPPRDDWAAISPASDFRTASPGSPEPPKEP